NQPEQMSAVTLNSRQRTANLFRIFAVGIVENELGIADNGIEWRAQLMTHIREELRLVLACLFQLATFLLQVLKQSNILDCNDCLVRKGGNQLDLPLGERTRNLANQYNNANGYSLAQKRHAQHSAVSGDSLTFRIGIIRIGQDVGNMYGAPFA